MSILRDYWLSFIALFAVTATVTMGLEPTEASHTLSVAVEYVGDAMTAHPDMPTMAAEGGTAAAAGATAAAGGDDPEEEQRLVDADEMMDKLREEFGDEALSEFDDEELRGIIEETVENAVGDDGASSEMHLNPDAGDVSTGQHRASSQDGCFYWTERLYRGIAQDNQELIRKAQMKLLDGGHYEGHEAEELSREGFQTLIDEDGGVFLPTTVAQQIYDIEDQVGAISQVATELPITGGREKIPNVLGNISFHAINEFSEAQSEKFNFGGITLDPLMWGAIVPWSLKMEREAGSRLMPVVNRKIAEASARFKDDTFLNGDGGHDYHGIRGVYQRADDGDVTQQTPQDSSASTFGALTAIDWLQLQTGIPASRRSMGVYVTHPDRKYDILSLQTQNDGFYFYQPSTESNELSVDRLWGRPIYFTDQHPNTESSNEPYATYFDPNYVAYGRGESLTSTRLTEGTIPTPDGQDNIRLGSQFAAALRVFEEADFEFGLEEPFVEGQLA